MFLPSNLVNGCYKIWFRLAMNGTQLYMVKTISIIDEISMFSLKMIEQVQHVLCKIRQSDYPFGGVQMI
jgi:hypothetical protein